MEIDCPNTPEQGMKTGIHCPIKALTADKKKL
jgi:hypothetical protein